MEVDLIIKLLTFGAGLVKEGLDLYNNSETVFSETDKARIKEALTASQVTTQSIFPVTDAALDQAKSS